MPPGGGTEGGSVARGSGGVSPPENGGNGPPVGVAAWVPPGGRIGVSVEIGPFHDGLPDHLEIKEQAGSSDPSMGCKDRTGRPWPEVRTTT